MSERPLPPVTQLAMLSMALIVAGGIYLSAHLPRHVPLGPAVIAARQSGVVAGDRVNRGEARVVWRHGVSAGGDADGGAIAGREDSQIAQRIGARRIGPLPAL